MGDRDVDHPELGELTAEERAAYRRAFRARRTVRDGLGEVSTLIAAAVLFFLLLTASLGLALAAWMLIRRWTGSPLTFPGGVFTAMLGALSIGLAIQGTAYFLWRHRELEDRRRFLVHLFEARARCPSCGYELAGAAQLPGRPGVVRCPECGLVNPAAARAG